MMPPRSHVLGRRLAWERRAQAAPPVPPRRLMPKSKVSGRRLWRWLWLLSTRVQVVVVQVVAVDEVMAGAMVERMAVRMDDAVEAVMEAVGEGAVAVVLDAMDAPPAMLVMGAEVQVDRLELAIVALAWAVVPAEGWVPVAAVASAATMAAAAGRQAVHSRAAKAVAVVAIVAVAAATTPHTAAGGRCRPGRAHTSKARRCADHNVGR